MLPGGQIPTYGNEHLQSTAVVMELCQEYSWEAENTSGDLSMQGDFLVQIQGLRSLWNYFMQLQEEKGCALHFPLRTTL